MLEKLIAIQQREELTDAQFAAKLGISRPLWNMIRRGVMGLSASAAITAVGVWPELTADLLSMADSQAKAARAALT